ncbi:hypothetical protein [Micromonospora cremea]|uniref:DUF3558 domain-containing protein n=1 Tax=Micromonospora cremea TaxID=709881 RepID=A0A1N5WSM5_9ACTN|nr:hypothetical protein [Micromonospora cremea]SIM88093.1 hypothetical protein SAMN04489832_2714 [Micromonospora cremea]
MLMKRGRTRRSAEMAVAMAAVLIGGSACGGDGQQADAGVAWEAPTSSAPQVSAPARLAEITSACKLLPAEVTVKVLGGSADTKLSAEEQPVDETEARRRYSCAYGRDGQEALSFIVQVNPDRADTARESIDAIANGSGAKTTRIEDLGTDAVTYESDGARVLAVVVPYEKELRLLLFTGPTIVPQSKLTELAQHVIPQI